MRPIISTAVTCLSITAFSQIVDAQVSGESQGGRAVTLEEVVVTAQKREERLQDVPISIAVVGGDTLDKSSDRTVLEAVGRVPGVFTGVSNQGGRQGGNPMVVVRGVSSPSVGSSTTGYYLDSIPYTRANQSNVPDLNPYDLDRVEVLRGPQGTLYGASALNGVVRVLTKNPNLQDFEFKARGSLQNTENGSESYTGDAAFNVPLIQDKLAARIVLSHQDLGGWIDKPNLASGPKEDANDIEKSTARVKLAVKPSDNLSIGLSGWFQRTDQGSLPTSSDGGRTNSTRVEEGGSNDLDIYNLDLGYDTSLFSIRSATSYMEQDSTNVFDFTPIFPFPSLLSGHFSGKVVSEELVLSSTGNGPWRWTLGSLYRDSKETDRGTIVNLAPPPDFPGGINKNHSKSIAVYGELTRTFADGRFELTGGLRYFEDKVRDWEESRQNVGTNPDGGLDSIESTFEKTTPRVVLTWHPTADSTLYASYAKGFRSGIHQAFAVVDALTLAGNPPPPAQPDTLTNYEIGAKATLGRFAVDSAVYYIDWQDPQSNITQYLPGPGGNPSPNPIVISGGSVTGIGVDLAVAYSPVDSLALGFNVGWNDLTFDDDVYTPCRPSPTNPPSCQVLLHPKGTRRLSSPETTAGVFGNYSVPLGSGYRGRISASVNYVSDQLASVNTTLGTTVGNTIIATLYKGDSMTISRASFTLEAPKHWTAMLFADNIGNQQGLLRDAFSPQYNTVIRPRTYGLQIEYRY